MRTLPTLEKVIIWGSITGLFILILWIDSVTPLGMAIGILYTVPVLLSLFLNIPIATIGLAILGVACTTWGLMFSPGSSAPPVVYLTNRSMSVGVILFASALGLLYQRTRLRLEKVNQDLAEAMSSIKILKGMLPICANCKRIRNDSGYWEQIESYISHHTDTDFSHGICPDCYEILYGDITPKDRP